MNYKTGNPALNKDTFDAENFAHLADKFGAEAMTIGGTAVKTGILALLVCASGACVWSLVHANNAALVSGLMWLGILGGFVIAMVICFNKSDAPFLSPVYAILEGLALGGISAAYDQAYKGIVLQAIGLTITTLFTLLLVYASGVRPSEHFKLAVMSATGGICVLYLVDLVSMFAFHWQIPFINDYGIVGICFSIFVCIVAALNLILDFDFIEKGVEAKAPKFMEWYGAFGILVTLVWLYLEILRLLAKARRR